MAAILSSGRWADAWRLEQNGCLFADYIFKNFFWQKISIFPHIFIQLSFKFALNAPIDKMETNHYLSGGRNYAIILSF